MSVTVRDITNLVEAVAPQHLAESWDNVGLQVGDPNQLVTGVLVTLDVNQQVVDEAIAKGANLIISHHPYIFKPVKALRKDSLQGEVIFKLIEKGISLFVAHTNLDSCQRGVNQVLAEQLGLQNIQVLAEGTPEELVKIVTFVPKGSEQVVLEAMCSAGAGWIGNYSHCTYQTTGFGTFLPLEGTHPYIGRVGELERTEEIRLETIAPKTIVGKVVAAMLAAHPYEEVAYDLYPLLNQGKTLGLGRIGTLPQEVPFYEFAQGVKQVLGCYVINVGGDVNRLVQRIAVCGGSGSSLANIAIKKGAQVLVTGDVKYHEAQAMVDSGMNFIDAGHFETEQVILPVLAEQIKAQVSVPVLISETDVNPRKQM